MVVATMLLCAIAVALSRLDLDDRLLMPAVLLTPVTLHAIVHAHSRLVDRCRRHRPPRLRRRSLQ